MHLSYLILHLFTEVSSEMFSMEGFLRKGNTEKRLRYARLHNWTEHDVLRRDESKFEIFGSNHSQHVRRTSDEQAVKMYLKNTNAMKYYESQLVLAESGPQHS